MLSRINNKPSNELAGFLAHCAKYREFDIVKVYDTMRDTMKYYKSNKFDREILRPIMELEKKWYDSCKAGDPDYSVYDDNAIITDVWACWVICSRTYLRAIVNPKSLPQVGGVWRDLKDVKTIADIGCGFGLTTSALAQMFPKARVFGTQIKDTLQYKVATDKGAEFGFSIASDVHGIGHPVDLVFASEYFEHFQEPLAHLDEVIETLKPKYFIIANAFTTRSLGHFDSYLINGEWTDPKTTTLLFRKRMAHHGFKKQKITVWNGRPEYYKKQ